MVGGSRGRRWMLTLLVAFSTMLSTSLVVEVCSYAQNRGTVDDDIRRNARLIEDFHKVFYKTEPFLHTRFLGIEAEQYPSDNWVMQEIIFETKPDYIIETGTAYGGTTLFYAVILAQVNPRGRIITIDINGKVRDRVQAAEKFPVWKERVELVVGNSTDSELVKKIAAKIRGMKTLVTLDSDHRKEHVLKELELYSPLVPLGGYLVVQDTHLSGHPVNHMSAPKNAGPFEAVQEFLAKNREFVIDKSREKYLVSQYLSGFLKRVK
jgi:cephalosporin hydroxylase